MIPRDRSLAAVSSAGATVVRGLVLVAVVAALAELPSPGPLSAQAGEAPQDGWAEGYHFGLSGGWVHPAGSVEGITDLVRFPSAVEASSVYRRGLGLGVFLGRSLGSWLVECDVDARLSPVTDAAQALVDRLGPLEGRRVDVEYATFELFGGRWLPIGQGPEPRVILFGGVGGGVGVVHLSQGTGVSPYNDEGLSASVKVGAELRPIPAGGLRVRLSARYQLLSLGVDVPNDVMIQAGLAFVVGPDFLGDG